MKALSQPEIETLLSQFTPLLGLKLQKVALKSEQLSLGFWDPSLGLLWWIFDFKKDVPFIALNRSFDPPKKSDAKPILLFLRAHGLELELRSFGLVQSLGRVVELCFDGGKNNILNLQFVMIPNNVNITLKTSSKAISLCKPRVIPELLLTSEELGHLAHRSFSEILSDYHAANSQLSSKEKKQFQPEARATKLSKIERALMAVQRDLDQKLNHPYRKLARELEEATDMRVSDELAALLDPKLSRTQNIERAYLKAKSLEAKVLRTQNRLQELLEQKDKLQRGELLAPNIRPQAKSSKQSDLWKGRTLTLDAETVARFGRSAKDNLELLRQSRPWHLWFHLKDYPSSHGLLSKTKSRTLSAEELNQIGARLLELTIKDPSKRTGAWDLLMTEVRFVRPVKKSIGSVTVAEAKTIRFRYSD